MTLRSGVRALAAVASLAFAAAGLPGCSGGAPGGYEVTAYFTKTVSLYDASDVRVLGLPSGKVTEIAVDGQRVKVTMRIDDDVPLPADVKATIIPLSLIGERYVQLFPAWTEGDPRARAGAVIPLERTSVPVEPDEALAALKKFLEALDPEATGRLVTNLADDLRGNGQHLNDALRGLATLSTTLSEKDAELASIVEHFDEFTATLAARESQLGRVMDGFADTIALLAEERRAVEQLVKGLGQVSVVGLDLVSEHRTRLQHDLDVLTRVLQSVNVHLDSVALLLDSGPLLVAGPNLDGRRGLAGAHHPHYHHLDLRQTTTPTLAQLFLALGIGSFAVCLPIDVSCTPTAGGAAAGAGRPSAPATRAAGGPVPATSPVRTATAPSTATATTTPIDAIVDLLGAPGAPMRSVRAPAARTERGGGPGGWLRRAGRALAEVIA